LEVSKMEKKSGTKFVVKYGVSSATIYRGNTEALRIPPPNHPLYDATAPTEFDPIRVAAIDRDGKMSTPIEVYTAPDEGILWVLDGRGRFLDVQEVNRRRTAEGRELVEPLIVPFPGDEKAAVMRLREKNYHRRAPTPSGMALDLLAMRNAGHTWEACAAALHVVTDDAMQWGRRLMPLAFCIEEVRAAVDAGDVPRGAAKKFGGTALDGSKALGKKAQLELLDEYLTEDEGEEKPKKDAVTKVGMKARERAENALINGASAGLKGIDNVVARAVAATIARLNGDAEALAVWPNVAAIVDEAFKPLPVGRPKTKTNEEDASA
jgi:hypothetical protein